MRLTGSAEEFQPVNTAVLSSHDSRSASLKHLIPKHHPPLGTRNLVGLKHPANSWTPLSSLPSVWHTVAGHKAAGLSQHPWAQPPGLKETSRARAHW